MKNMMDLKFCLGDCMSGKASGVGKYAGFQNYLVKKLRELKYCVGFRLNI